jgi:hypothetical protein
MPAFVSGLLSYGAKQLAQAKAIVKNLTDVDTQSVRKSTQSTAMSSGDLRRPQARTQAPHWTTRYNGRWPERLGVYRLAGHVHWATAHPNR